ncbi:hypothetical protein OL548_27030 [Lysinibacillus sp. MHQ-1]|nr:hypothetical protein OL548_27030 [Lysinibacillus sp. MHQ-1]
MLAIAMSFLNLGLAETERPQLLTRSFDRELLVKKYWYVQLPSV